MKQSRNNLDNHGSSYGANWLDQVGASFASNDVVRASSSSSSSSSSRIRENMLLLLAEVFLIGMVLLGPLMTINDGGITGQGTFGRQIGYLSIAFLTMFAISQRISWRSVFVLPWPVLLSLGWCWLSLFWAIDPEVALRRIFLTTLIIWIVFTLVSHAGYRLTVDVLRYSLLTSLILSYFVVYLYPEIGIHQHRDLGSLAASELDGNWRGIYAHKNFGGAVASITILLFIFDARHIRPAMRCLCIITCLYFLWRCQSKTSGGMMILSILGGWIFMTFNTKLRPYAFSALLLVASLFWFLVMLFGEQFMAQVINPSAFTGRGYIWMPLIKYAADHPLTGAGFGSFWNIQSGSPIFGYGQGFVTTITVGHSGYIDQLITVGIPGLLLMVFAVVAWPLFRLFASKRVIPDRGSAVAVMIMFCVGHNVTESGLYERDMIVSTIFFFAAALAYELTIGERWKPRRYDEGNDVMRAMRKRRRQNGVT